MRPRFAPKVIAACCILHNLCKEAEDQLDLEEEEDDTEEEEEVREDAAAEDRELSGNCLRARLATQVSAPEEVAACLSEHDYI